MEQVVVECSVDEAGDRATIEPSEVTGLCAAARSVRLLHSYVSLDGKRKIYVFQAPDAESVRVTLRCLGLDDLDLRVWTARGNSAAPAIPR